MRGNLPARHPWAVLFLALLVTGGAILGATRLEPEVDFVDAVPASDDLDAYRRVLEELDGTRFTVLYMAREGASLRSEAGFDGLVHEQEDLTHFLEARFPAGTFSHSLSIYEAMRGGHYMFQKAVGTGSPPRASHSLPNDPVTWDQVRQRVLDASDSILAADGSSALVLLFFSTDDPLEARALSGKVDDAYMAWASASWRHTGTQDHASTGFLYAGHITDERNQRDLQTWGWAAAGAIVIVLWWALRRPDGILIAGLTIAAATTWTFGLMGWWGIRISFLTVFLAPLVMGVGIDASVHLLHRHNEERARGADRRAAIIAAFRATRRPIVLAAITSAAGLAMLLWVPSPLFAQVGGVAALGLLLALLATLTITPALRSVLPDRPARHAGRTGPWVASAAAWSARRPMLVLSLLTVATLGAAAVATQNDIASGASDNEFPQDDPNIVLQHRIEAEYGAFQRAYLIIEGPMADAGLLQAMHALQSELAQMPLVIEASSVTDLLIGHDATDDGVVDVAGAAGLGPLGAAPDDAARLPSTDDEAMRELRELWIDPFWRTLAPFVMDSGLDLGVIALRLEATDDADAMAALRADLQAAAKQLEAEVDVQKITAGGAPLNRAAVVEQTPINLAIAIAGAAGAVAIILTTAWWRRPQGLRLALAGAGVVLVAALWLLASVRILDGMHDVLHTWGAPANQAVLNDMFLLAFAITVAVGIDDWVHIVERHLEERQRGPGGLRRTFEATGRAITGTTLMTCSAFVVLAGMYFLQSKNLAILAAAGVAYAYVLTLLVAPIMLRAGGTSSRQSNDA